MSVRGEGGRCELGIVRGVCIPLHLPPPGQVNEYFV